MDTRISRLSLLQIQTTHWHSDTDSATHLISDEAVTVDQLRAENELLARLQGLDAPKVEQDACIFSPGSCRRCVDFDCSTNHNLKEDIFLKNTYKNTFDLVLA